MQKDPNSKHLGNPGHNEKTKPKDNRYRRERRFPTQKASKYLQQDYRRKLPKPKERDAYRTPNRLDQKRNFSQHKTPNVLNKGRILKAVRKKGQVTNKGRPTRITPDFSTETMKDRRS